MRILITLLLTFLLFISSRRNCFTSSDENVYGSMSIGYLGPVEMENSTSFLFSKDTLEVYKKGNKILYKTSINYDSVRNGVTLFSTTVYCYFLFEKDKETGLYYLEKYDPKYRILNTDSITNSNYKGIIINDSTDLTFLKRSELTYDKEGNLYSEKYLMTSKCSGRKDTSIFYYSSKLSYNLITLSPYIDSLRNTKLVKYEVFVCGPDTTNPNHLYRLTAKREIQDIGIIQVKNPVYKIFTEMEKQYSKMIR